MSTALKMTMLFITWVIMIVAGVVYTWDGSIIFGGINSAIQGTGIPMTAIPMSTIQFIFPFFYALILIVMILGSYRILKEAFSGETYYPGA